MRTVSEVNPVRQLMFGVGFQERCGSQNLSYTATRESSKYASGTRMSEMNVLKCLLFLAL